MPTSSSVERQLDILVDAVQELAVARRRGDDAVNGILPRLGELLRDTLDVIGGTSRSLESRNGRLLSLVQNLRADPGPADRFVVRSAGRMVFVRADDVDWIEAAGNYVRLHAGGTSYLLRETMTAMQARLDPVKFLRIHRSRIVNVERIDRLQPWLNGEYAVVLRTGARLTLSRGCREKLEDRLDGRMLRHPRNL
jgi:DNA-binding LytR/AlgR family response regulator